MAHHDPAAPVEFVHDACIEHAPRGAMFGGGCACGAPASRHRRLFTGLLAAGGTVAALPAWAREGVQVDRPSQFSKLVSAEQVEKAAQQQYLQMQQEARAKNALAPDSHPQVIRLRAIAERLRPFTLEWNPRAANWRWEVNLIGSKELNAFCMPGGKIAFYLGILEQLQLDDGEVAMIMGHEMAHALREHARERMGKTAATRGAIEIGSALLGLGDLGRGVANMGGQLLTLTFSRQDESEADLIGIELAARAGYDPRSGITLWQKMGAASKGAPPKFLSTHPPSPDRIRDIEKALPQVEGLYARAPRPTRVFGPPPRDKG
jgi:Zn-dependent protease with chaperone function